MQQYSLTVDKFLDHAAKWHGEREVVSIAAEGAVTRAGYAALRERANRLSGALAALGVVPGVASRRWPGTRSIISPPIAPPWAWARCATRSTRA